ncbi:class I SAM-dependent methyltransferase [Marinobacter segnicrescens]|uniref:class I SAM-dependent methyltransferase n=1 Tax=Marinobacter segnicrescens TaxID=430453 RepID=UPI003A9581D3
MTPASDGSSGFPAGTASLTLHRPHRGGRSLRAWDAADEQLVAEALKRLAPGQRVAVVDDSFGALALGLADFLPDVIADSAALAEGLALNARANGLPVPAVRSWEQELEALARGSASSASGTARYDAVILKVPRQLEYLGFLLRWCNQVLRPGGWILAGGMIKHLPDQAVRVYQELVVTEAVLPAKKKARLVLCQPGTQTLEHWDRLWRGYPVGELPAPVQGLPAVFARDRLDIGSRELLPFIAEAVTALPPGAPVLDLACGNGLLGLVALSGRPDLAMGFADISSQAIISARVNVSAAGLDRGQCRFYHADGAPPQSGPFRMILLNPPFHEGGAVGDHIALRLFAEAAGCLTGDGELLMVGNRHLGYHRSLRSFFTQVQQLHASPRFVVFRCTGPRQPAGRS